MSAKLRFRAFVLYVATIAVFFSPIVVIFIFDWLGIYSDIALVITSVIIIGVLLAFILMRAYKIRKEVLKEEQEVKQGKKE